jgi:hypothetical protein
MGPPLEQPVTDVGQLARRAGADGDERSPEVFDHGRVRVLRKLTDDFHVGLGCHDVGDHVPQDLGQPDDDDPDVLQLKILDRTVGAKAARRG